VLLADTSIWLAAADRRSDRHGECATVLRGHRGEQAANLAAKYAKLGISEQTLTSGQISTELLQRFGEPITPAGEGPAFFVRNELLPFISDVTTHGPVP
jgi:hypothetical protein